MSPRNPTTRCSPRAPKIKEQETGEGYSPRTTRQLEYVPRVEPFIKTTTNKFFIQLLTFGDTEASTRSNMVLVTCKDMERWYEKAH
jgi:hypothetical protein